MFSKREDKENKKKIALGQRDEREKRSHPIAKKGMGKAE